MALIVDIRKNLGGFVLETSFRAEEGVTGILGASGCGKSMTLRCIAGIVKPDEGHIELDGRVLYDSASGIHLKPQERHVGLLFQNYALFPNMTVYKNLQAGLRAQGKDRRKADEEIRSMMEIFSLEGLEKRKPHQLSGGQQQRVALARILLSRPSLLMLDEPFSALDEYLRWKLEIELTQILEDYGGTTLFVSHSRNEIYRICDRVCVMDQGHSSPVIRVQELFTKPETKAASLLSGCKNYSEARSIGDGRLMALDWGVVLKADHGSTGMTCIGVRSHYIHFAKTKEETERENAFSCRIERVIEDVFSMIILVRPIDTPLAAGRRASDQGRIRVELSKDEWKKLGKRTGDTASVWIDPVDVMCLSDMNL